MKGYGLGANFEARNATHQMKKLTQADLKTFRDLLQIPVTDAQIDADSYQVPYYKPSPDSDEIRYLLERRRELGGYLPERRNQPRPLPQPEVKVFEGARRGSGKQLAATTMAFVRLLRDLIRDKNIGPRIVPIVPDEARTFGMDSFFPTAKIYNPHGQRYTAVDRALILAYKESGQGQILHTGINEAGSVAAFTAAGTAYATHGEPMIPVYVFSRRWWNGPTRSIRALARHTRRTSCPAPRGSAVAKELASQLVEQLQSAGVRRIYGIVGDSLNPIVEAVRRTGGAERGGIDWVHVRHEEAAAFAAAAEAQLTGRVAVCAGSCGPGNLHLINGLYDANRSGAPSSPWPRTSRAARSAAATSRKPTPTGCSPSARSTPS